MAGERRRPSIQILDGAATLNRPTKARPYWRINYNDPITGKQRTLSGGASQQEAEAKAAEIFGHYVPSSKRGDAPIFTKVVDGWIDSCRHRWSSRTPAAYEYIMKRYVDVFGDVPINKISPSMISSVKIDHLSRGQQMKVRTVVRGVFTHAQSWLAADPEDFAKAVHVIGSKSDAPRREVSRGDIPPLAYIHNLLLTCYHSAQSPDELPEGCAFDSLTGHKVGGRTPKTGFHVQHGDVIYRQGVPSDFIDKHKRGRPKHYGNSDEQLRGVVDEAASIFRRYALCIALGAGAGLRIGEVLALRVHHLLTVEQCRMLIEWWDEDKDAYQQVAECGWRGGIRVEEQVSKTSKGVLAVSLPKMNKTRHAHLPAFLPGRGWKYAHTESNLYEMPREEAWSLFMDGYAPLAMMVFDRLAEIVSVIAARYQYEGELMESVEELRACLLFPTRNPLRSEFDKPINWHGITRSDPITGGGYIGSDNWSRAINPVYDYVSSMMNSYPLHRIGSTKRSGWTHHGLRHFAISSRLKAGQPVASVADEFGHEHAGFTLDRYAHTITDESGVGFQFSA